MERKQNTDRRIERITRGWGLSAWIARRNLAWNRQFVCRGFINGQGRPPTNQMRYSLSTLRRAGCGIVAIYNALLLLGNPHSLPEVIAWGDRKAAALFGLLGTLPWKAKKLFRQLGYQVDTVRDPVLFDRCAQGADACLFTFWNQKGSLRQGMHTVCLRCWSGRIEVYNLTNSRAQVARMPSLQEWVAEGIGPVVLYCIRKKGEQEDEKLCGGKL